MNHPKHMIHIAAPWSRQNEIKDNEKLHYVQTPPPHGVRVNSGSYNSWLPWFHLCSLTRFDSKASIFFTLRPERENPFWSVCVCFWGQILMRPRNNPFLQLKGFFSFLLHLLLQSVLPNRYKRSKMGVGNTLSPNCSIIGTNDGFIDREVFLNVYDLTPLNSYSIWLGFGVFHTGIEGNNLI